MNILECNNIRKIEYMHRHMLRIEVVKVANNDRTSPTSLVRERLIYLKLTMFIDSLEEPAN